MGVLSDRLDSMRVQASSPDGKVAGELRDRTQFYLSFVPGSYWSYDETTLEQQLVGLAQRIWSRRMEKYYAAVSEAFGETVTKESPPVSPRDFAFYEAREKLVAEGRSADERIYIALRGMRSWTVRIREGTLRRLTEEQFAAHMRAAVSAFITDQYAKVRALKLEIYR